MTVVNLLEEMKKFSLENTKDLIMPTSIKEGDIETNGRTAEVYLMRLPDSKSAKKKAPYILHQFINSSSGQQSGQNDKSNAVIRSIFCVYSDNEQEGGLMLLNLMERMRIGLLKSCVLGNRFVLDKTAGVETMAYPDDTAPYYCGEMVSNWIMPSVEREVPL